MSDYTNISEQLTEVLTTKTKINPELIQADLNFEHSGLDSFARIELILVIEEKFNIELSDAESANIATVDDLINIILEKQA